MLTADSLKHLFGCKTDTELGLLFGKKGGAVSVWRRVAVPAAIERRAYELMKERGIVSEPETTYKAPADMTLDEVEKMIIRKMKKRGKAYQFRWLAEIEAEEEAERKNNPAADISVE